MGKKKKKKIKGKFVTFLLALVGKEKLLSVEVSWKWITGSAVVNFMIQLGVIIEAERTWEKIKRGQNHRSQKDKTEPTHKQTLPRQNVAYPKKDKGITDKRKDYRN